MCKNAFDHAVNIIDKENNMLLLSSTGSGKTFTMQTIAMRLLGRNRQCFIIAPLMGHEFRHVCDCLGGQYIKISPSTNICMNLLDIRVPNVYKKDMIGSTLCNDSLLAKKIQYLRIAFMLLVPKMTDAEALELDEALIETYHSKGITFENASLLSKNDPTHLKEMPIFEDLYNIMIKKPQLNNVATIIYYYISNFNGHTNVNLDNKYTVFDISDMDEHLLTFGMFVVLDFIMGKVKQDRLTKEAVIIDEIWPLISLNRSVAYYVLEMFKTICGYGGVAIAASQSLNDFFALEDGKFGRAVMDLSSVKIIKHLEAHEADAVQKAMNLTPDELRAIRNFSRTEGLLCIDNYYIQTQFVANDIEKAMITENT